MDFILRENIPLKQGELVSYLVNDKEKQKNRLFPEHWMECSSFSKFFLFVILKIFSIYSKNNFVNYSSLLFLLISYIGIVIHLISIDDKSFAKSWDFVKKSRNFIYWSIGIFLVSAIFGYFIPLPQEIIEQLMNFIKELFESTKGMNWLEIIEFIFFNNSMSGLNSLIFGIFLGIFPIIASIFNGYFLGFVSSLAIAESGVLSMWRLLPHGVFELPAIFISFGLGMRIGFSHFRKKENFKICFLNSLRTFIFIVVPLLIIAAIIEGTLIFFIG